MTPSAPRNLAPQKLACCWVDPMGRQTQGFGLLDAFILADPPPGVLARDLVTGGWGAGKSNAAAALMVRCLVENGAGTVGVIAGPTEEIVVDVMLPKLGAHFPPLGGDPAAKFRQGSLSDWVISKTRTRIVFRNGGVWLLKWYGGGGAKATAFGLKQGFDGSYGWTTETQALKADTLALIGSRFRVPAKLMRLVHEGLAEDGSGFVERLKTADLTLHDNLAGVDPARAKEAKGALVRWWAFDTRSNPYNIEGYVDSLLSDCPQGMEDVFLKGLPAPKTGRVCSNYDDGSVIEHPRHEPGREVRLFADFGYNNPYIGKLQTLDGGPFERSPWVVVDEWVKSRVDTEALWTDVFRQAQTEGWLYDISRIAADPAVVQHSSKAREGRTDRDAIRAAWATVSDRPDKPACPPIQFTDVPRLRLIREGCAVLNRLFCDGHGARNLFVSRDVRERSYPGRVGLNGSLQGYKYRPGPGGTVTEEPLKDNRTDHACDALRIAAVTWRATELPPPAPAKMPAEPQPSRWAPTARATSLRR